MAVESSQIPEKTVEQIFDERYPLDKWKDSNYSILDKFSMRGRKGFVSCGKASHDEACRP